MYLEINFSIITTFLVFAFVISCYSKELISLLYGHKMVLINGKKRKYCPLNFNTPK